MPWNSGKVWAELWNSGTVLVELWSSGTVKLLLLRSSLRSVLVSESPHILRLRKKYECFLLLDRSMIYF